MPQAVKMSDLQKRVLNKGLPPMPPVSVGGKKGFGIGRRRTYTPVSWDKYFDTKQDVAVGEDLFRVYTSGTEGPVCFFLHGGGFSALSWACLSQALTGLVHCRCAAMDIRGHGDTKTVDEVDLSASTLTQDIGSVIQSLYGEEAPPVILIGHSMGGALAVHVAHKDLVPSLIGLMVIDVVEGTALDALNSMHTFLRSRPSIFRNLEHAIEWGVRSGHVRNVESARVSMVGQLKRMRTNETATSEMSHKAEENSIPEVTNPNAITEEDEDGEGCSDQAAKKPKSDANQQPFRHPSSSMSEQYTWRIDLEETEQYWRGWFEGLSDMFLACNVPKMLLLAGVDRLDKALTVGQMQGKFQMQVLPQVGHAVHEDNPDRVAEVLATFMTRHKVAEAKDNFQRSFPAC